MKRSQKTMSSPVLVLIIGILAVSTASIFIRFAQKEASSLVIAAYRMTLAGLILAPFALPNAIQAFRGLTPRQKWQVVLSGLFLAIHFASWITSLEYTTVASSVVLVTTTPLWVAILSPIVLKEKMQREIWLGLILAMAGGTLVGLQQACVIQSGQIQCLPLRDLVGGKALLGNALALFGAFMAAGYMLMGRQV